MLTIYQIVFWCIPPAFSLPTPCFQWFHIVPNFMHIFLLLCLHLRSLVVLLNTIYHCHMNFNSAIINGAFFYINKHFHHWHIYPRSKHWLRKIVSMLISLHNNNVFDRVEANIMTNENKYWFGDEVKRCNNKSSSNCLYSKFSNNKGST